MPALYLPAIASGAAVTALNAAGGVMGGVMGSGTGFGLRCAGVLALLGWTVATFAGTVPINSAVVHWQLAALPDNWLALMRRWERLDSLRTAAAGTAFVCFLAAAALG